MTTPQSAYTTLPDGRVRSLQTPGEPDAATREQPAPYDGGGTDIWDLVIAEVRERWAGFHLHAEGAERLCRDAEARSALGRERYGVRMVADNGRDHFIDAYQEVLDALVYWRAHIEATNGHVRTSRVYKTLMQVAVAMADGLEAERRGEDVW